MRTTQSTGTITKLTGLILISGFFFAAPAVKAESGLDDADLRVIPGSEVEKQYPDMLFNFLLSQAKQASEKLRPRMDAIQTEAQLKTWQDTNRQKFLELIGGLPSERTPLNPRVVGEFERAGYVVRKVIFESQPEVYVTANLYVPTMGKPPYPAVLSPLGHSTNGKAYDIYQHLFIGLAQRGYVVFTWDPLGQGERVEYWDSLAPRRRFDFNQHGMAGLQQYLLGQNLARNFIWDGMRALDYLTSLPEVDASRVGITGSSGGGTLSTYISMLDPRIKAAAIVTFITSLPKKIENRHNDAETDPEQDVQGLLAAGIDHPEYVGMIAPRPVQLGAAMRDFFPIEGTRATFKEVQALYTRLGIPERTKMVEFDHPHMYSQPLREATTAWFERWLKGAETEVHEPPITTEKEPTLLCTSTGQVITSLGGKRTYDLNRAEAERQLARLAEKRKVPGFSLSLSTNIRRRLALPDKAVVAKPGKISSADVGGLTVEKLLLESETGIVVPVRVVYSKTGTGARPAVIYLRDRTGEQDSPSLIEGLARQGRVVAVADVRGFGETKSARNVREVGVDYFDPRDGMDADFTYASFFLGRPLLGMRVWDALHVAEYLGTRPDVDSKRVGIAGRGWASLVALFAAALDSRLAWAACVAPPPSYGEIARSELYAQPASLLLPSVLQDFDLPDVLASLAPRPLLVVNPTDAVVRKMDRAKAAKALDPVTKAYGSRQAFDLRVLPFDTDIDGALRAWILGR
ncbi:MAG: acetylxylan esterase [Terriglobia bacterium]